MKIWSVFIKCMREQLRDFLSLSLSLSFAPLMILLYWLFFNGSSTTYTLLIVNQDKGYQTTSGTFLTYGEDLIKQIEKPSNNNAQALIRIIRLANRSAAENMLRNRDAAALVIIGPGFSEALQNKPANPPEEITFVGDLTNFDYILTSIFTNYALDDFIQKVTAQIKPVLIGEEPLGGSGTRTSFESYVPGILVFSVIMLIFQASMTLAREVENGTLRRLQLTHLSSLELLGGTSLALVITGIVAILLTFLTAALLGFHSQGPLWVAIWVGVLTSISIIGAGLVVACFSQSVSQAFIIANFPLALFMFFTGSIFPIPRVPLFTIAGRVISLYDFLAPTHAVVALNKIFTLGSGLGDVAFELAALTVLSILYFGAGIWLFGRTHLRSI
jgi:ABC-2 type transport system permease protein